MIDHAFDAIVVGAGVAGCRMARELAAGGLRVAVVEAGPVRSAAEVNAVDGRPTTPADRRRFTLEGQTVQAKNHMLGRHNRSFYVNDRVHPYVADRPFLWFRGRQVGGRNILWTRACLRMSDREFTPHPGASDWANWPFGQAELSRWYDRAERDLGVRGEACGDPAIPDGAFAAPAPSTPLLDEVRRRWNRTDSRLRAGLARIARLERAPIPVPLAEAVRHGARVLSDAPVARIVIEPGTRRAAGVELRNAAGPATVIGGGFVVLCASTIESVAILWRSRGPDHPHGIGNHSDLLGRGIQDHLAVGCAGWLAADLAGYGHASLAEPQDPWHEEPAHLLVWGREPAMPPAPDEFDEVGCLAHCTITPRPSIWSLLALAAARPLPGNRITVADLPDRPVAVPRVSLTRTTDDLRRLETLGRFVRRVAASAGLGPFGVTLAQRLAHRFLPGSSLNRCRLTAGAAIHETGGARMGSTPADSVVDPWGRCWDTENVYVADGSVFPNSGFQNPTLTILALASRTAARILEMHAAPPRREEQARHGR